MKLCQSSLKEPNENWQCILRSDEPKINESGSNEVQNVWHRRAWDHHCECIVQKHGRVSAGMSAKKQQHTAEAPEQYSVTVNRITGFVLFRSHACKQCLCMCICVHGN